MKGAIGFLVMFVAAPVFGVIGGAVTVRQAAAVTGFMVISWLCMIWAHSK